MNTTSKVQLLDAGIIPCVKAKYKRRLLLRVFDNLDKGEKYIYNVDVLTAMRWTVEKWDSFSADVIRQCFLHCLNENGNERSTVEEEVQDIALQSIDRDVQEHGVKFTKAGIKKLLNPQEENNDAETLNREDSSLHCGVVRRE